MANEKNLFYLDDMPDYKVADEYTDVRGWHVEDAENRIIGKVDGLLVNKDAERVVYLDVEVDKSIIEKGHEPYETPVSEGTHEYVNKEGENHIIIPIGIARINEDEGKVHADSINHATFAKTRRFRKGADIDRGYEAIVFATYFPDRQFGQDNLSGSSFYEQQEFGK